VGSSISLHCDCMNCRHIHRDVGDISVAATRQQIVYAKMHTMLDARSDIEIYVMSALFSREINFRKGPTTRFSI